MRGARHGLLCALLLCGVGALAQPLRQEVTPAFDAAESLGGSLANTTLALVSGAPQFTLSSDASCAGTDGGSGGASAAAGAACTPEQWLAVALRDVYEVDTSNRVVPERSAAVVLDLAAGVEWEADEEQLGSPEVPAFQGTLRLPFKQQLPACPGGGGSAPEVPPDGGLTLRVQLFGGLTNVTYVDEVLELLPGNVKWSVLVEGWPWCDAANKLVLAFGLLPANASAFTGDGLVVESGAEVQERLEKQQDLLTGAADPGAVPMPDNGSGGSGSAAAPPPDPAAAGAAGRRRLMARRGGGIKLGGSAPTKPASKPPVVGSGSSSSSTPVSVTPSSAGKPYRPYFPAGGASRPRFPTAAAALGTLPFAAAQRPYLASRYYYNRPVYGFGRRPFLPYSTFLFFPLLFGASRTGTQYAVAPAVDMQQAVLLDNTTTAIARVEVPPAEPSGVQPVLVSLPHFNETAQYDSIATISESDLAVTEGLEAAIAEVMAWNDTVTASSSSGSHSLQAQMRAAIGLAAAVAGVLLLV